MHLNPLEWVHFVAASLALVVGPLVLILRKGTRTHIRLGYLYTTAMLVVNVPVFFTYELFGRFGIFHGFAVVSLVTLAYGMGSALLRWPRTRWLRLHLSGMYWSVMGLYFAGIAQILSSTQASVPVIAVSALAMAATASYFFGRYLKRWQQVPTRSFRPVG
ncbi:MAG: hypothetical protein SFY70_06505 [Bacteroidia bacterium]|nr:hypothetical protein [Bacteroidia bacterium]